MGHRLPRRHPCRQNPLTWIRSPVRRIQKPAAGAASPQPFPQAPSAPLPESRHESRSDTRKTWLFDDTEWRIQPPAGPAVSLTAAEYKFLSLLVVAPGEPVSRQDISLALTGRDWDPYSRSIDSLVRRLRMKVEERAGAPLPVQAVHGVGYAFVGAVQRSGQEGPAA
ncbi:winged helix-turn-helix domain-containing protein [Azospirillum thermophilum]|uniref:winged helix-turn-helix domain-containing protein n=1 Tax=Azospirillum thermophilum TaxID=2202148 RepID=UPI001FE93043|nr:helix-turn-helix domain-containing protein [Azospirillum thermophilum]